MNREDILDAVMAAFLPPHQFSSSAYSLMRRAALSNYRAQAIDELQQILENTGYQAPEDCRHTMRDLSSQMRLGAMLDFSLVMSSSLNCSIQGFDPGILNEFPAQRLIQTIPDNPEPASWPAFWLEKGGQLHGGAMVALKWDRVWWNISAFNLPVPPFQLGSTLNLEDVDRDEAESFGLIKPRQRPSQIQITLDLPDLTRRLAAVAPVAAVSMQPPCKATYPALPPPPAGILDHFIISVRRRFSQKSPPR